MSLVEFWATLAFALILMAFAAEATNAPTWVVAMMWGAVLGLLLSGVFIVLTRRN